MAAPDAAVVIVNYRTPELTDRCLKLLDGKPTEGLELERVVVDNASGDGSVAYLRGQHPSVHVIEAPANRGFASGVNAGFSATSAPYVVVLNPDTTPRPGAVTALVDHIRANPRVGVAAPILLHADGSVQRNAHRRFPNLLTLFVDFCVPLGYALALKPDLHPHELSERVTERGGPVEHVNGSALAIRRTTYEDAGPFDEGFFMYLEETEWQQRVRRAGWSVDIVPAARVVHVPRGGAAMVDITSRYLPSIYRYMRMQGHRETAVDAVLALATALSRVTLATIARVFPSKRRRSRELLAFHRSTWDYVKGRRRA